ncbi:SsgA family sporulation/cell division regulator [Streptomyces coeruleofuscus]|uniref:SsgA family sporulation/cell division regulator n=1 Tax=Streptomyces coeruleofuscus TaxID=66879 RepID=A0ABP5WG28_9ACTN
MSVHKDDTMPATADDEFAALMAASSLRAPRVRALDETIPDDAQRQLHAAAVADPTSSTHCGNVGEPDEELAVSGDSDDGERTRFDDALVYQAMAGRLLAWLGFSARGHWRTAHALLDLSGSGRPMRGSRPEDVILTAHAMRSLLCTQTPSKTALSPLIDRRLRDLRSVGWHITAHAPRCAFGTSQAHVALALLQATTAPEPTARAAYLFADHDSARTLAEEASELEPQWALTLSGELADSGAVTAQECGWTLLAQHRDHPLAAHAARIRLSRLVQAWQQEVDLDAALVVCQHAARMWDAGKANNSFSTVTHSVSRSGGTSTGEKRGLAPAGLTDLLYSPQPAPLRGLLQWPNGGKDSRPWEEHVDLPPHDAAHWLLSDLAARPPAAHVTGLPFTAGQTALAGMPRPGADAQPNTAMDPACLLVAADLAVDLNPAHRQAIPAQPPPLPDLDAYAPRPGASLLLPRKATDLTADYRQEDGQTVAIEAAGQPRLWSRKDSDGHQQLARIWMRLHRTEQDKGQRLAVRLVYRTADPYAVTAVFNHGTDEETEWLFARELLVDGLHESVGIGDVIVWPSADEASGRQRVFIRLRSPEGTALLSAAREDIEAFLDASHPLAQGSAKTLGTCALDGRERELADIIWPRPRD